jgi:hypothetical protein
MDISVPEAVNIYILPPGRGIHALERVAADAAARRMDEIAAHATAGIASYHVVRDLQIRLRTSRASVYGPDTTALDGQVDRCLTGVDHHLESQLRIFPLTHPRASAAITIRQALYPEGVGVITSQSFVQQRVAVDRILDTYHDPSLAPARSHLPELDAMMDRLAELNRAYGASIDAYERDRPTGATLRAAQERSHAYLTGTVVLILARYLLCAPEQRAAVAGLYEHIQRQNEAVRLTRRRRRQPVDVDPGTGVELPEANAPAPSLA